MDEHIRTYGEFWPHYLREHANPTTRRLHFAGTALATGCVVALVVTGRSWLIGAALLGGYGPAWIAHLLVERNRPATFTHPLWSLISDYRMAWSWITGKLPGELSRAGVEPR